MRAFCTMVFVVTVISLSSCCVLVIDDREKEEVAKIREEVATLREKIEAEIATIKEERAACREEIEAEITAIEEERAALEKEKEALFADYKAACEQLAQLAKELHEGRITREEFLEKVGVHLQTCKSTLEKTRDFRVITEWDWCIEALRLLDYEGVNGLIPDDEYRRLREEIVDGLLAIQDAQLRDGEITTEEARSRRQQLKKPLPIVE